MKEKLGRGKFEWTPELRKKMSEACKGELGSKAYNWTGDYPEYQTLHQWIAKWYGKADKCENEDCPGKSKYFDWANISGEYKRDRADFKMLCRSCHRRFDSPPKESCPHGHAFTPENTYIHPTRGFKSCRTCSRERYHRKRQSLKELSNG